MIYVNSVGRWALAMGVGVAEEKPKESEREE